jgi:asparagine synthetase B (glutamine-hydrolysing)
MCGIHATLSVTASHRASDDLQRRLRNRGPDHLGEYETQIDAGKDSSSPTSVIISLVSTVLSLRGDNVTKQPFLDELSGSAFCWNGEAWGIGGEPVLSNDGASIFTLLRSASLEENHESAVLETIRSIEGPFAFVYVDKRAGRIYYGRDRLGRRSLLIKQPDDGTVCLSSLADSASPSWTEVEADGIYVLGVDMLSAVVSSGSVDSAVSRHEWLTSASSSDYVSTPRFGWHLWSPCGLLRWRPTLHTFRCLASAIST